METWERRTQWPLMGLAVAFLVAYAYPIIDPDAPEQLRRFCSWVTWAAWIAFALDYAVRLYLTNDRPAFIRHNLIDLAAILLPALRPLRLLRLVILIKVLNRSGSMRLRGQVGIYVVAGSALLGFIASLAMLDAERGHPDNNIATIGDALWWAAATMTTVGYGDHFPVSTTGRFVAVGLMLGGIALLGTVTAMLASWIAERVAAEAEDSTAPLMAEIRTLRAEVAELKRL